MFIWIDKAILNCKYYSFCGLKKPLTYSHVRALKLYYRKKELLLINFWTDNTILFLRITIPVV